MAENKNNLKRKILSELFNFFDLKEGYSREELISEYIYQIQKEKLHGVYYSADEIALMIYNDEFLDMTLQDFADYFYEKVLNGVKNVITSELEIED